ncbi:outer membrane beta-barrel protein [Paenochrobactrum pullorum]|uniref:outer membrane beta-barrel protein n=1 Tax=Paenochrobactrum pullorum TaxID=1324351 RepID=UPI0035BC67BB
MVETLKNNAISSRSVCSLPLKRLLFILFFALNTGQAFAQTAQQAAEEPSFWVSTKAARFIQNEDEELNRATRENLPQEPEQGSGGRPETDPYAALGIRSGSFILRPTLEQGLRVTSNANNSSTGRSAVLSETQLRLGIQTDLSRHAAFFNLSGNWVKNISGDHVSEPFLFINSGLRLDIDSLSRLDLGFDYMLRRESASSPNSLAIADENPLLHTLTGKIGFQREGALLFGRADAQFDRNIYGDADLIGGGTISQSDRNNNYVSAKLRGGFQVSAALKPFVEVEAGKRFYDDKYDHNGFQRSGDQYSVNAGLMFDMGEKFNGEFSVGYLRAQLDDDRLRNIDGLAFNALVNWSPQRGTDVALNARTLVEGATAANVSGSLLYLANLEVKHQVRSNLMLTAGLDTRIRDNKDNTGFDYTYGAQIGATYSINRLVALNARLRHEQMRSDLASREYKSNSIYVGIKLQR